MNRRNIEGILKNALTGKLPPENSPEPQSLSHGDSIKSISNDTFMKYKQEQTERFRFVDTQLEEGFKTFHLRATVKSQRFTIAIGLATYAIFYIYALVTYPGLAREWGLNYKTKSVSMEEMATNPAINCPMG